MEFGALQCVPVAPHCETCPLTNNCVAYRQDAVAELPFKEKKVKVKDVFFYYAVLEWENGFFLKRRNEQGIWKGLYDFPLLESAEERQEDDVIRYFEDLIGKENKPVLLEVSENHKHLLSHRRINARFYRFKLNNMPSKDLNGAQWFKVDKILEKGVPRLIERYFESVNLYK